MGWYLPRRDVTTQTQDQTEKLRKEVQKNYDSTDSKFINWTIVTLILGVASILIILLSVVFGIVYSFLYYTGRSESIATDVSSEVMPIVLFYPITVVLCVATWRSYIRVSRLEKAVEQYKKDYPWLRK
jgi:ABC-type maltose transport system permease subunit